jgi:DNA-binding helix-hairpin-helix protein with protein kinase domain
MPGRQPPTRAHRTVDAAPAPTRLPFRVMLGDGRAIECRPEPFSSGSEGRLYHTVDNKAVVKIYSRPEEWRRKSLETIIKKRSAIMAGHPDYWARYFCWPEALVVQPSLGMIMPRAQTNLRPFSHLLAPRFRARLRAQNGDDTLGSWIGHVGILIKLARTVNRLHLNGLCHSDLSTNNVLVDPKRGDATLIDCDGLVETGSDVLLPTVLGTPDYMAPELVRALSSAHRGPPPKPSVETDLHSLAVLVYQGLLFRHPLRGSAFHSPDPDEDDRLMLGEKALYIEHPTNHTNRPKKPFLTSAILGPEMQGLLARAFVEGAHKPSARPLAAEWERALVRLYDQTVPCSNPACEAKSFVLVEGGAARCPWCRTELRGPRQIPLLGFYRSDGKRDTHRFAYDFVLVGWPRRTLHAWHVDVNRLPGPGVEATPLATIGWQPQGSSEIWTLHNQSIGQAAIVDAYGGSKSLATGDTIELRDGLRLIFGAGERTRLVEVRMRRV